MMCKAPAADASTGSNGSEAEGAKLPLRNPSSRFAQVQTPTHGQRAGPTRKRRPSRRELLMGYGPQFIARIDARNGVARIALEGELDIATAPVVGDHIARFEEAGAAAIMLDLRDLTFVDCSALRIFLAARERSKANGHRFILVGDNLRVRRLFKLCGTEFLLDEQEAASLIDQFTRVSADPVVGTAVAHQGAQTAVAERGTHV